MIRVLFVILFLSGSWQQLIAAPACRVYFDRGARQTSLTEEQIVGTVDKSKSYQDKRNKEWSQRRRCLCCHTTLPYMLSRGLDQNSKANFEKFKDMAAIKVEDPQASPWYHGDHVGRNSKPTEAVVNALTLIMYDISNQSTLSPTTIKSVSRIFEMMDADGHIHWLDFKLEPFESKKGELWGNSMAILAIELVQKHSNFRAPPAQYAQLKNFVLGDMSKLHLHEMSVLLWSNSQASSNKVLSPEQVLNFTQKLKETQNLNGSWNQKSVLGQGKNKQDIYATSISVIGLIKAGHGDSPAVHKAVKWLADQQETGNYLEMGEGTVLWRAKSMNRTDSLLNDRFASDFATSYSALALQLYQTEVLLTPPSSR